MTEACAVPGAGQGASAGFRPCRGGLWSAPIPVDAQAIAAVGGFHVERADGLPAIVDGDGEGAVQAAVVRRGIDLDVFAVTVDEGAIEHHGAPAAGLERDRGMAAAVDVEADVGKAERILVIVDGAACAAAGVVSGVIPDEAFAAAAVPGPRRGAVEDVDAGPRFAAGDPGKAEMIPAITAVGIADVDDGGVVVAAAGGFRQADLVALVLDFEGETAHVASGQRHIAFRAVVAGFAAGQGTEEDGVAAHGGFDFLIHLEADVALPFAGGNVAASHLADVEL